MEAAYVDGRVSGTVDLDLATTTIAAAGAALSAAGRRDATAPVAACPGWSVADLIRHVGRVHLFAATIVREGAVERPAFPAEEGPLDTAALVDWTDAQRGALLDVLAHADPDRVIYAFGGPSPARFWWRRQANETAVHAWDGTSAVGSPWEIPAEVAADAVEELLDVFAPRIWARAEPAWGAGRSIHLHRTDGDGEWLLTIGNPPVVERGHAKGDLAVRGPAAQLLLWTMNRAADVELFGDTELAGAWGANFKL